jgi:hypothetical protein
MERLVRVKRGLVSEIGFLFMPSEDSAETKHEAFAGDSTKTRWKPSTQPKPETRQRLCELLAHKPSIRLGRDSAENLAAGFPSYWISISSRTSKLIRGDESAEIQTGTSSPSDGASCLGIFILDFDFIMLEYTRLPQSPPRMPLTARTLPVWTVPFSRSLVQLCRRKVLQE